MHSDSFLLLSWEETDLEDAGLFPPLPPPLPQPSPQNVREEPLSGGSLAPAAQLAGDMLSALKNPWAFSLYLLISAFRSKSLRSGIGLSAADVFL